MSGLEGTNVWVTGRSLENGLSEVQGDDGGPVSRPAGQQEGGPRKGDALVVPSDSCCKVPPWGSNRGEAEEGVDERSESVDEGEEGLVEGPEVQPGGP